MGGWGSWQLAAGTDRGDTHPPPLSSTNVRDMALCPFPMCRKLLNSVLKKLLFTTATYLNGQLGARPRRRASPTPTTVEGSPHATTIAQSPITLRLVLDPHNPTLRCASLSHRNDRRGRATTGTRARAKTPPPHRAGTIRAAHPSCRPRWAMTTCTRYHQAWTFRTATTMMARAAAARMGAAATTTACARRTSPGSGL